MAAVAEAEAEAAADLGECAELGYALPLCPSCCACCCSPLLAHCPVKSGCLEWEKNVPSFTCCWFCVLAVVGSLGLFTVLFLCSNLLFSSDAGGSDLGLGKTVSFVGACIDGCCKPN